MRFQAAAVLFLSGLPLLASSAPVLRDGLPPIDYEAVIVGGGPAGLSALSGLARVRRTALLIDSGEYRNGATRHMHDVLGYDGVTPAFYRWAARMQLAHYSTVSMRNGTVSKIEPMQNNSYFRVIDSHDGIETTTTALKIVLATGLCDLIPDTPGLRENWGKGIYWCPWCDGHEHADQKLGLLAPLEEVPGQVREILTLNKDIVAFVNGTDTPKMRIATDIKSPKWEQYLDLHKVDVENRTIVAIERLVNGTTGHEDPSLPSVAEHDLFQVKFTSGEAIEVNAFLTSFKNKQASSVGQDMGVKLVGGKLLVDGARGLATNVPGVYAIGDANSDNVTNVPHALFSGKRTAVYMHVQLERETAAMELQGKPGVNAIHKRSIDEEARAVWDIANGPDGDPLHAGEFDQYQVSE